MKPRDEWGPADEAAHGIMTLGTWATLLMFGLGIGAGVTYAVGDEIERRRVDSEWNVRGYIGCKGGGLKVENITVDHNAVGPAQPSIIIPYMDIVCPPLKSAK